MQSQYSVAFAVHDYIRIKLMQMALTFAFKTHLELCLGPVGFFFCYFHKSFLVSKLRLVINDVLLSCRAFEGCLLNQFLYRAVCERRFF